MNITIAGGTGLIGRRLAALLRGEGHRVVVAARSTGVDLVTGQGLAEALAGADIVIDASNAGYAGIADMERFFSASSANLLAAAQGAGVARLAALSVVGADTLAAGYYRAKRGQEQQVAAAGLPIRSSGRRPFSNSSTRSSTRAARATGCVSPL